MQWNVANGATTKTKTLFAYLLHCGVKGASAEEIADLLWPQAEFPEQKPESPLSHHPLSAHGVKS